MTQLSRTQEREVHAGLGVLPTLTDRWLSYGSLAKLEPSPARDQAL